jgi:hypothetical protein
LAVSDCCRFICDRLLAQKGISEKLEFFSCTGSIFLAVRAAIFTGTNYQKTMKIAFIGLGIMGSRMATNLISDDTELNVYNRTSEKAQELIKAGAKYFGDPGQAVKNAKVVFTMLTDPSVVESLAFGEDGFVDHMPKNALWIDCTTVDPSFCQKNAGPP